MSTVNNNTGSIQDPTLVPSNPTGTPTTTSTTPTDTSYYSSDIAPAESSDTTAGTTSTATSSATPSLLQPDGRISMSDYSKIMSDMIRKFTESSYQDDLLDITIQNRFHESVLKDVIALKALIEWSVKLEESNSALQKEYGDQIDFLNGQIKNFNYSMMNPQDQAALKAINDAINAYKDAKTIHDQAVADFAAGIITQEQLTAADLAFQTVNDAYQLAVTNYNDYTISRNLTIAAAINDYNTNVVGGFDVQMKPLFDMITQYNALASAAGLTPIPYPSKPGIIDPNTYTWRQIAADPVPTARDLQRPNAVGTYSASAPIANIQAQNEIIQNMIDAAFDQLYAALKYLATAQHLEDASVDYYEDKSKLNLTTVNPLIEDKSVQEAVENILKTNNATGTPSGLDFLNLFARFVSQTIPADAKNFKTQEAQDKVNSLLQMVSTQHLVSSGIFAGKTALQLLGENLGQVTPGKDAAKIAVALGFAKETQKLANGTVYQNSVKTLLEEVNANPDEAVVDKTAEDLKLTGALMSLFQIARALQKPDLLRQLIDVIGGSNIPALQALLEKPIEGTLVDALIDPISRKQVRETLAERLSQEMSITKQDAEKIVRQALDSAVVKADKAEDKDLPSIIKKALQDQNVDAKISTTLTDTAIKVLQDEQKHPELILSFSKDTMNKLILQDPYFTNAVVTKAVNDVMGNNTALGSLRQFRTELAQELQVTGMDAAAALAKANEVLEHYSEVSRPAINQTAPTPQSEEALKNVVSKITLQLLRKELPVVSSHEITNALVAALFGDEPTSVTRVIKDSIRATEKNGSKEEATRLADRIRAYLAPQVELYAFAQALMDPANNILYSGATGIMYQGNEPSNYKKSIDVLI